MHQPDDKGTFEDFGYTLDKELQRLIDFVENRVVPAARQDSEVLLRKAARMLDQLADHLAKQRARGAERPAGEEKKPEGQ